MTRGLLVVGLLCGACHATVEEPPEVCGSTVCPPAYGCPTSASEGFCIDPGCGGDGEACDDGKGTCKGGGCQPACTFQPDGSVCLRDGGVVGTCVAGTCAQAACACGDVDINHRVDAVDVAKLGQYVTDPAQTLACEAGGDVIADGKITPRDESVLQMIVDGRVKPDTGCMTCARLCADVNGDNKVDVQDVTALDSDIIKKPLEQIDACLAWAADTDHNGVIDMRDVDKITQNIFNPTMIPCAP